MKKVIIAVCICLVILICVAITVTVILLREEQIPDGIYSDIKIGTGTQFEFEGKNVSVVYMSQGETVWLSKGTYTLSDNLINFDFPNGNPMYSQGHTLYIGEGYIEIDGSKFEFLNES